MTDMKPVPVLHKDEKRRETFENELRRARREDARLDRAMSRKQKSAAMAALEAKIPDKVRRGLDAAFSRAFAAVFNQGQKVIGKSYDKEEKFLRHGIHRRALAVRGGRKDFRELDKFASSANSRNMALSGIEGLALGALGIGLPDIVLFIGLVIEGMNETALSYGYDCDELSEKYIALKIMELSLTTGEERFVLSRELDELMASPAEPTKAAFKAQTERTAAAFALDMLLLKFVQGLPIVGLIGGAGNPVYYRRILRCAEIKYKKRYLESIK